MALTSKRMEKLLRRGAPGRYLDARGLYLVIVNTTSAHWEKRYQLDGREHYLGLGSARVFGLAAARERSRQASELLADGKDPLQAKRAAKAERIAAAIKSVTFGTVAQDYFQAHSPHWKHAKHVAQWRSSILGLTMTGKPATGDYCRTLRTLPITAIDTPIVLSVLKPIWQDKPDTMLRVRARIAAVIDFARAAGYRRDDSINPADWKIIGKVLPVRDKTANHFAAIHYREIPAFVAELRKREGTAARALEFLIYTTVRSSGVRLATLGEINFSEAMWTIPANRMKAGKEHKIPLAPEALELLRSLPREDDGADALIFAGPQPGRPLSDLMLMRVMQKMGRRETVHGFRSTFTDWSNERTAHSSHTIEISLAHAVGSAVEQAYRRGDMLEKRRALMTAWTRYCLSPPAAPTGEVVAIRRRS